MADNTENGGSNNGEASNITDIVSAIEQLMTSTVEGIRSSVDGITNSLSSLQGSLDKMNRPSGSSASNGMPGVGGAGMASPGVATPVDISSVMERLVRTVGTLNQTLTDSNKAPEQIPGGKAIYSAGQVAEMQRHMQQIGSGRVNTDIPTFATQGPTLQPSPLSTLHRSNDLLGLNLGLSGRAERGQYPTHDNSIGIGSDLKSFLGKNEMMIRTLQGSLGKSYEYAQNAGQTGDDYRNTVFARSKMQSFYASQAAAGTPVTLREQGLMNVGLNERAMRDSGMLTSQAGSSLSRLISAHQSAGTKYSPFISLSGGEGEPGQTVSTKSYMKADQMGAYGAGLLQTMTSMDQALTAGDVKQSVVNDIRNKANSIRDNVVSNILTPGMAEKIQGVGVNLGDVNLQSVQSAQEKAGNAHNTLMKLNEQRLAKNLELNKVIQEEPHGDEKDEATGKYKSPKVQKIQDRIETLDKRSSAVETQRDLAENIYKQGRSDITNAFTNADIQKLNKSGDQSLQKIGATLDTVNKVQHGSSVYEGTAEMTRAEKVKGVVDDKVAGGNEFAAAMMKNLQWSLMFAFSGTVFQALSQIPQQATYETVQPVYSGISNIMGLSPLKNEVMGFGERSPAILGEIQDRTNSLQSLLGSRSAATQAVSSALDIAKTQPIHFTEAMQVMTSMATLPSIKSQAANPAFQKTMLENVQMLGMVNPEQGTGGALFAIREMLAGQYRSLQMRFQMSPDLLASYAGKTTTQMKSLSGVEMMNTMNQSLMGMFGGSEILMRKGAEGAVVTKNITDTMASSILNPMASEQNPATLALLRNAMGTKPGDMGKLTSLLPDSQQQAIRGAALESVAGRYGVKYEREDSIDSLAQKYTEKRGGSYDRNKEMLSRDVGQQTRNNVESLYGTPAGAQSLILTGINKALGSVLTNFSPSAGISSAMNGFLTPFMGRMDTYDTKVAQADKSSNSDSERKAAAHELVSGFFSDVRGAIHSVAASVDKSELKGIIKEVTDTVRIGAQEVFAPIGKAIMIQTAKTAIDIPRVMIGGGLSAIGGEALDMTKSVGHVVGKTFRTLTGTSSDADKKEGLGTSEGVMRGAASAVSMLAWQQGIAGLRTAPLRAAAKFGGLSLVSQGISELADGSGGTSALLSGAFGTALTMLPQVFTSTLNRAVATSVNRSASRLSTGHGVTAANVGAVEEGLFGRAGAIGGGVVDAVTMFSGSDAFVLANKRRKESGILSSTQALDPTTGLMKTTWKQESGSGLNAAVESLFGTAVLSKARGGIVPKLTGEDAALATSAYTTKGFFGSYLGKGLGVVGGTVSAAVGAHDLITNNGSNNAMQTTGSWVQAIGGATAAIGPFIPVAGTVVTALGLLASGIGGALNYFGGKSKEKEEETFKKDKDISEQRDEILRQTITIPETDTKTAMGKSFDAYSRNAHLDAVMEGKDLDEFRKNNETLSTYHIESTKGLNSDLLKIYDSSQQEHNKGWGEETNKLGKENDFIRGVQPLMQDFASRAFAHPEAVYTQKDGIITNTVKSDVLADLTSKFKGLGLGDKEASSAIGVLLSKIDSGRKGYDDTKANVIAGFKNTASDSIRNFVGDARFGNTRPEDVAKDSFDTPQAMQALGEKVVRNINKANALQKEGAGSVDEVMTSGVGLWGVSPEKALAYEKAQGAYEAKMLENGNIDPKAMAGPGGLAMRMRVAGVVGEERAEELGSMNYDKHMTGILKNEAGFMRQIDKKEMPSGFSARDTKEMDVMTEALSSIGNVAGSSASSLDTLTAALTTFLTTVESFDNPKNNKGASKSATEEPEEHKGDTQKELNIESWVSKKETQQEAWSKEHRAMGLGALQSELSENKKTESERRENESSGIWGEKVTPYEENARKEFDEKQKNIEKFIKDKKETVGDGVAAIEPEFNAISSIPKPDKSILDRLSNFFVSEAVADELPEQYKDKPAKDLGVPNPDQLDEDRAFKKQQEKFWDNSEKGNPVQERVDAETSNSGYTTALEREQRAKAPESHNKFNRDTGSGGQLTQYSPTGFMQRWNMPAGETGGSPTTAGWFSPQTDGTQADKEEMSSALRDMLNQGETVAPTGNMSMSEIGEQMSMMSQNPGTTYHSGGLDIQFATEKQMALSQAMAYRMDAYQARNAPTNDDSGNQISGDAHFYGAKVIYIKDTSS